MDTRQAYSLWINIKKWEFQPFKIIFEPFFNEKWPFLGSLAINQLEVPYFQSKRIQVNRILLRQDNLRSI